MSEIHTKAVVQQAVYQAVTMAGPTGLTISEVRAVFPEHHHGTLSGVLSILHRDERICRLAEKRGGNRIYLAPAFAVGQVCEPQGGYGGYAIEDIERAINLHEFLEEWFQPQTASRFKSNLSRAEAHPLTFVRALIRHRRDAQ